MTRNLVRNLCLVSLGAGRVWPKNRNQERPAFTLIELLVVIIVVSILLAIALPALGRARTSARVGGGTQVVRQLVGSLGLYAGDHRGEFPFFGTPGDPYAPVMLHGKEIRWGYFRTHRWFWASVVYPEYIDATRDVLEGLDRAESLASQGFPSEIVASRFQMSSTAFADPRFWRDDPEGNWMRTSYFRAMRHADVVHPASKGILGADLGGPGGLQPLGPEHPIGLADGSARTVTSSYLDSKPAVSRPFGALPFAIEATPDGLAGRDF